MSVDRLRKPACDGEGQGKEKQQTHTLVLETTGWKVEEPQAHCSSLLLRLRQGHLRPVRDTPYLT